MTQRKILSLASSLFMCALLALQPSLPYALQLLASKRQLVVTSRPRYTRLALSTHTNYNRCRRSNLILYDRNLSNELGDESFTFTPKRITYLVLWVGLVAYTFLLSPGGSVEASAKDTELIKTIISTPFDGSVSPVFVAIFNALGILPAVLGSLLLSGGGKNQRVPAFPFVFSSFFLGFFGIGPYLFLRKPMTDVTYEDRGRQRD